MMPISGFGANQYTLPQAVTILSSDSHMHKQGTNFESKYYMPGVTPNATGSNGTTLFQTTEWAEPPAKTFSPPLQLPSGSTLSWSCTYQNNTGATEMFGESAQTNVMCISVSIFYPVSPANLANPLLGSAIGGLSPGRGERISL